MTDHLRYRLLGQTVDDAAGEAFDKVGRLLGLPYPGGPAIMRAAEAATHARPRVPARVDGRHVRLLLQRAEDRCAARGRARAGHRNGHAIDGDGHDLPESAVAELAYGFQESVVDVLIAKTLRAAEEIGARTIVVGGGVAANSVLRERIEEGAAARGIRIVVPRPGLCTDNASMIGAAGFFRARAGARGGPRPGCQAVAQARRRTAGLTFVARTESLSTTWMRATLSAERVERYLRRHGLAANKGRSQNHLVDSPRAGGHRRAGRPESRPAHPRDRPRAGHPDRRAVRRAAPM